MFEVLEHTADIGFRARAPSLSGLFEAAAEALVAIVLNPANIVPRDAIELSAQGESNESLLVNWLSEVLYWLDGERFALRGFQVHRLGGGRIAARATGERRDCLRHEPRLIVKGVTYHQLKIGQNAKGWWCEVYLDV
ncbi:MAG TPA: archease [Bryobacteraceae bacterium]|nr:archease [Bryobacteraceae bacterium]